MKQIKEYNYMSKTLIKFGEEINGLPIKFVQRKIAINGIHLKNLKTKFLKAGLIEIFDNCYHISDKGRTFLTQLKIIVGE